MAATVLIPPSPHAPFSSMTTNSRRAPLASIPNAANSPHHFLTASGSKRSRGVGGTTQQENEPPYKRQAIEKPVQDAAPVTPRRQPQPTSAEGRVFERGTGEAGPNAFQRKLVAAREKAGQQRVTKHGAASKDVETVRQWQRHYRKLFPGFHFYFDSIPDDHKLRMVKQINALGAHEENFFSKSVTHIITTRSIPQYDAASAATAQSDASKPAADDRLQSVNLSGPEKTSNGRAQPLTGASQRRDGSNQNDILHRGLQMGMKVWTAEKLQRMLASLLEDKPLQGLDTGRPTVTSRAQNDLQQALKHDKLAAGVDKETATLSRELQSFRGPFIYVHDMDEKVRAIMVREYPKVVRRQDGEWPQFRSASIGKCPFVEDPSMKKELEQERARQKLEVGQQQDECQGIPRTRSKPSLDMSKMEPPTRLNPRKVLREVNPAAVTIVQDAAIPQKPAAAERQSSFPPMPEQPPVEFIKPSQMMLSREPSASGIQRSNITSAIQSQMISSAAATGLKAGTSREVNELKRKVLERTHTGSLSIGSIPSSHRMTDLAGVLKGARAPAPQRAAKSKAQEKLGGVAEEEDAFADDMAAERTARAAIKKKTAKKDPKPGYCENCRDKYDDFDEHILSRKHRKFAVTTSNWTDLDALLQKLQVP